MGLPGLRCCRGLDAAAARPLLGPARARASPRASALRYSSLQGSSSRLLARGQCSRNKFGVYFFSGLAGADSMSSASDASSWGQPRGGGPADVPRGEAGARRLRHQDLRHGLEEERRRPRRARGGGGTRKFSGCRTTAT